jgi:mRNA interferase RelE/StbE
MPAKQFLLLVNAQKRARRLPNHIQKRLPEALIIIQQNPIIGVKLHGELAGYFKYRLGDYRIVYTFNTKTSTVEVVAIEHRQGVYK